MPKPRTPSVATLRKRAARRQRPDYRNGQGPKLVVTQHDPVDLDYTRARREQRRPAASSPGRIQDFAKAILHGLQSKPVWSGRTIEGMPGTRKRVTDSAVSDRREKNRRSRLSRRGA